jgi:hypothetical protein
MAKTKIEVDLVIKGGESVEQVETKTKSLKTQLKEMKALLASGTLDNQAFSKLSAEAGALQDQIGDVNEQVKNLASDSQKLDGFISITQGIVGGFAAVQGITAMVGVENEDLQKTMVKLQGAMSALAGIQAVANTLNKTSAAYTTANTIATNISTFAQKQYAMAVGTSTGAMKVFRIAMASLGIGLVIAAIGYLITNFDKLKGTVSKFLPSLDSVIKGFKAAYNAVTDFLGITNDQTRAADKLKASSDKLIKTQKNELEVLKAGNATKKQIYLAEYKMLSDRVAALDKIAKLNKKYSKEEAEERAELIQEIKLLNASYLKEESDAAKERAKTAKEEAKKTADERAAIEKKALEDYRNEKAKKDAELKALSKELSEQESLRNLSELDKEIQMINNSYNEKMELAKGNAQLEQDLLTQKTYDITQVANKFRKEQQEQSKKDAEDKVAKDKKIVEDEKKLNADRLQDLKDVEAARVSIVNDSYLALNALGELALGQQFKNTAVGKSLALAQIATDTALGFIQGLKIAQQSAIGLSGPAAALTMPVFYASQVAAVLGAANKAKSLLGGGGSTSAPSGSGASGGGGSMSSQPPRLDTFQSNRNPMSANQRVYVLEKDITDSQGRVARIRHNATLI